MLVVFAFSLILFNSLFRIKSRYLNIIVSFIIVLILIYVAGFRTEGLDYKNYKNGFEWNSFREPFFRLLVTSLHHISGSFRLFLILIATLTVLLTYSFFLKNEYDYYWLVLLIFVSNYYFLHDYIQIRIGLACSIFLYQLSYLNKGDKKKAFCLWLLSCCCHFSMVIAFISFFISKKRISNTEECFIFLLFIFCFLFALKGLSVVSLFGYIPGVNTYYKLYMSAMENGEGTAIKIYNPIYLLRYFVFFLCILKRNVLEKQALNCSYYLRLYFCGIMVFLLFIGIPAFAFRGSEILFITELLLFPLIKFLFKNKNIGNLAVVFLALIVFVINVFHNHLINI